MLPLCESNCVMNRKRISPEGAEFRKRNTIQLSITMDRLTGSPGFPVHFGDEKCWYSVENRTKKSLSATTFR